jgi:predicted metal-binding membrane protein
MMVAMMLPSLAPLLVRYRRGGAHGTVLVALGYFSVWATAGVAAYAVGTVLAVAGRWWPAPLVGAVALIVAALAQWSPWKSRRLACCREFGSRAGSTRRAALRDGVRLGAQCCFCCTGLMTFLIVIGMMHLSAVVLVAALIALERFTPHPRVVARAAGVLILVVGAVAIAHAPMVTSP